MPEIDFSRPILAIDTASNVLSLALSCHNNLFEREYDVGNRQSEWILPAIESLFQEASIACSDLVAIVYNRGPGMFTGLRIGIGVAQGLSAAFATPLIGIPSLDVLAALLPNKPCVLTAIDARMGEVFYAWFNTETQCRLSDYAVDKAENIRLPEGILTAEGIGNAFADKTHLMPIDGHHATGNARLLLQLAQSGRYESTLAEQADLLYVRNKIALTAQEQADAKNARS